MDGRWKAGLAVAVLALASLVAVASARPFAIPGPAATRATAVPVTGAVAPAPAPAAVRATAPEPAAAVPPRGDDRPPQQDLVLRGRYLVISHDCAGCHGGADPNSDHWLAGETSPDMQFLIGPCYLQPGAQPCFHTHPRNLTPDNETGLGRFTERQIFNALRYGLRPEDTPDVTITSFTPGKGNFPLHPHYLAPPMPWGAWRYMPDRDLQAIAAYLKRAVKPVHNKVVDSEGPPDFWVDAYTNDPRSKLPPYPPVPFPAGNEQMPTAKAAPAR